MRDLSLHLLDIVQNSITAGADFIAIDIAVDEQLDTLTVHIKDNGCGISSDIVGSVKSPFTTSRTTRNVGLGIPLFSASCEMTGGNLDILSSPGNGTELTAVYGYSHIDRPPFGDIAETLYTLSLMNPQIDFVFTAKKDETFSYDTREIKAAISGVPITEPGVSGFIREMLHEGTAQIFGGNEI